MITNYTFAYEYKVPSKSTFEYQPFTVQFSALYPGDTGIATIKYENKISDLMEEFSIYYRVFYDSESKILTSKDFENITSNQQNLFFKYDINTGVINNTISVQMSEITNTYIQLITKSSCCTSLPNNRFGHISIINGGNTDTSLRGNLISLFSKIEKQEDLYRGNISQISNLSLNELFANNNSINFTRSLILPSGFVHGFPGLFYNCTGLLSAPTLNTRPLCNDYYAQMFQDCSSLSEVFVDFDSCFQENLNDNNGEFYDWLQCYNNLTKTGTVYSYSDKLIDLVETNEVAYNMMLNWGSGWTIKKVSDAY